MADPIIELNEIYLTLTGGGGEVNILRGIDFIANRGESVSITGPSGSGKTSVLMVIAGLEKPTKGIVRVADTDLTDLGEDELAKFRSRHVGIVFQSFHLLPTMTALENVSLPLELSGAPNANDLATEALRSVRLQERLEHYPSQLSGGELQRVALARAFVLKPSLILADEPTGNLDDTTGKQVMDLLFALQSKDRTTLVLVTHDSKLASRCDRKITMSNGFLRSK